MKVTLIATVLDAADHVGAFLASIAGQTRAPDEIVVVDGGSSDATVELLRAAEGLTVLVEPGANIARGRNVALAYAAHETIAVADADCEYDADWLRHLLQPLEEGADVSMGFYQPIVEGFLDACLAGVNLPVDAEEIDPATFMPSARSVAFRRDAIEAVGGWPEWLAIGEDMWVDQRWRERGLDMRFAPDAVARWRLRPTLGATWVQYFRYARGDAQAGMYPERHALRYGVYAGLGVALGSRRTWPKLLAAAGAVAYARTPVRRVRKRLVTPAERAAALVVTPALIAWLDTAKMAGYAAGLADRARGR